MLNREKMIKEVERVQLAIFKNKKSLSWLTLPIWQEMTTDKQFLGKIEQQGKVQHLSNWERLLADIYEVSPLSTDYSVLAVDGSQIYPDHHIQGIECFLINTGGCYFSYGQPSSAELFSQPTVYVPEHFGFINKNISFSAELVDLVREEEEFKMLVKKVVEYRPSLALFDGNLLFWHLESKPVDLKEEFCNKYCGSLYQLYQNTTLTAGYLSATRFRDLVELVKVGVCEKQLSILSRGSKYPICEMIDELTDAELLAHILMPSQRTTVLKSNVKITQLYPDVLKPHFFYLNTGSEIVRIEIPAWIASDQEKVDQISSICLDQSQKGYGYPVALAESHAQAVVQGADRNFFYQFLQGLAIRQGKSIHFSQKSLKKRILTV